VLIREVRGPRDGFQNEPETIPTADKIRLIDALGRAGFTRIEVASFVRPDVIPQLSDGVEVLRGIDLPHDVARMVLVPNSRGLDNALAVRELYDQVALFVSASQTHNQRKHQPDGRGDHGRRHGDEQTHRSRRTSPSAR